MGEKKTPQEPCKNLACFSIKMIYEFIRMTLHTLFLYKCSKLHSVYLPHKRSHICGDIHGAGLYVGSDVTF